MRLIHSFARTLMVAALALLSAAGQAQDGLTKTSVVLGQSLALTGPGSSLAVPFHHGAWATCCVGRT